jgi:hypothetical protein
VPSQGGPVIQTLILLVFAVAIAVTLVVVIGQMLVRRQRAREEAERTGQPIDPPRTPEEQARDRRSAAVWGCLVVAVPVVLALAYWLTRA